MKRHLQALVAVLCLFTAPAAQAGWFDGWFDGWFEGWFEDVNTDLMNFYAGAGLQVVRADFPGRIQRRIGGDPAVDPSTFFLNETGNMTAGLVRLGWKPIDYLAVEVLTGTGIDDDQFSEQPDGQISLESVTGFYLRPQYSVGSFTFFGLVGQGDYEFEVTEDGSPRGDAAFADDGFSWGAGIELHIARQGRLAFEYIDYFRDDDPENGNENAVTGIGISFTYLFGGGGDDEDEYY